MIIRLAPPLLCSLVLALTLACSPSSDATDTSASGAASAPAATPLEGASVEITGETVDALERGLRREIAAVRGAKQRIIEAKTPEERSEAFQASFETATIPQGAEAAGMSLEQYRAVRETVLGVLRTLDMQGAIEGPVSIDLSRADEATKERLSRDPLADLPAASAAALRARMDRLVPIWIEYHNLTAVAG